MPYEWIKTDAAQTELHLWPYRSLPRRGMAGFVGITAALLAVPVLGLIGSPVLWGLLPFVLAALAAIWWALQRSYRDGETLEVLLLSREEVHLTRYDPRTPRREWQANPYWVQVHLHPIGGPVPHYLTLSGSGREVELGAFLTEEERQALAGELRAALRAP